MDWLAEAQELAESGEPFALATVVRRIAPASARPGAKALIRRDGTMHGWVGGSCAQPVVAAEARKAIREGSPRLLRLGHFPRSGEMDRDGVQYPMTCHSGGALEILIEPILPAPAVVIVGETPIAETLERLAIAVGYQVTLVADGSGLAQALQERSRTHFVVVASMGDDEETLVTALRAGAPYVALVASPKRASIIRESLMASGEPVETLSRLKSPAGLNIGARTQDEIALSILAEIVQERAAMASPGEGEEVVTEIDAGGTTPLEAIDPVCGMAVTISTARHRSEYGGKTFHFCCGGCKAQFDTDPPHFAGA